MGSITLAADKVNRAGPQASVPKKRTSRQTCPLFTTDVDISSGQGVTCNQDSYRSSDLPDFEDAFLCIAVEVGLEKRRYLLFASSAQQKA